MKSNEQFTEIIQGLFTSIIQHSGVNLPSPANLEAMRKTSSKLSGMLESLIAVQSALLVKQLQDAVDEGFKSLEAEVEVLKEKVTKLEDKTPKVVPTHSTRELPEGMITR